MPTKLKIFYVTNARIPTEKAHGLAAVKLCEAFAKQGTEVTLFVPFRLNTISEDPYRYYAAERIFKITPLPSIDLLWLGFGQRFFFTVQLASFSLVAAFWMLMRYGLWGKLKDTVIFSHDNVPLFFASLFGFKIFYDIHNYPLPTVFHTQVLRKSIGLAVQTKRKASLLKEDFGVAEEKVVYWPIGTDVARFDIAVSEKEARERLNLPEHKKIVVYTGQLFPGRGGETLCEAGKFLSTDVVVYMVGGGEEEINKLKNDNMKLVVENRLVFVGQRPWVEMPVWLKAADVVVTPHSGRTHNLGPGTVSLYHISPMKLFEYMASGRPIVASDLPAIREVVDETMATFFIPDDPHSLARAIETVLANPRVCEKKAENALAEVKKYTWEERARRIIHYIDKVL